MKINIARIETEYGRLRSRLVKLGWISQGYVQNRGPVPVALLPMDCKVKAKTVSVALSQEQYAALKQAIENWRETQEILQQMQALSREVIFGTLPNPPRRKRLGKKVLNLNQTPFSRGRQCHAVSDHRSGQQFLDFLPVQRRGKFLLAADGRLDDLALAVLQESGFFPPPCRA